MSFKDLKVVYLPEGVTEENTVKFLKFPNPRTGQIQSFVLGDDDQLYEIEVYNGDNPHDTKNHLRVTTKKDSKAVRSLILENEHNREEGLILEKEEIYLAKKFNFVYCLISFFGLRSNGERYQTVEDLIEVIQEGIPVVNELPESLVAKSLALISDCIEEGDQQFYKYSKDKTTSFLKQKVELVSKSFPESIYRKLIKPIINPLDINEDIPSQIEQLAKQKYSVYLISSYLKPELQETLLEAFDFNELEGYITKLENDRKQKKLAEEQINDLNSLNANNKRNMDQTSNGPAKKKVVPAKKVVKKATHGPLDGFFKKK